MKVIAVIPARYSSSRFPGKPLADICGKPMIWWVYNQARKAKGISEVYVATDSDIIKQKCEEYGMNVVMTSDSHRTHLDRLGEFATKINADFYININGDEPLIDVGSIEAMIPDDGVDPNSFYAANGMMLLENPIDAIDSSKIKIATDVFGNGMYMARSPIPFPKGSSQYKLKKFVGVQCFTQKALIFCKDTQRGELEGIEDIDEFRFLENGKTLKFIMTNAETLSVDTKKDLDKVNEIVREKLTNGELIL